jgi:hypothetical protein
MTRKHHLLFTGLTLFCIVAIAFLATTSNASVRMTSGEHVVELNYEQSCGGKNKTSTSDDTSPRPTD